VRIGIEITQLFFEFQTGLFHYGLNLARGLGRLPRRSSVTLFTSETLSPARWQEITEQCRPLPIRVFRNSARPYRLRLALHALSRQDALFYVMGHIVRPASNRVNAFLVPDLTPLHDRQWHTDATREHWQEQYDLIRKYADCLITFSEHTKSDVVEHLDIPAHKIHAIPLAASERFRPLAREEVAKELQTIGLQPEAYILSVGTLEPRKNHVRLIRAFQRLRERGAAGNQKLVLAGPKGWHYDAIFAEIDRLGLQSHVLHLGHYPRLEVLMNGATVMAYPSLFEGFGLPPLEAMACGTPVLASNTSSLPEVVGNAGRLIDPHDEESMANALAEIIADTALRSQMRVAGLARAQEFSWQRTAQSTLDVLERAVNERSSATRIHAWGTRSKAAALTH